MVTPESSDASLRCSGSGRRLSRLLGDTAKSLSVVIGVPLLLSWRCPFVSSRKAPSVTCALFARSLACRDTGVLFTDGRLRVLLVLLPYALAFPLITSAIGGG